MNDILYTQYGEGDAVRAILFSIDGKEYIYNFPSVVRISTGLSNNVDPCSGGFVIDNRLIVIEAGDFYTDGTKVSNDVKFTLTASFSGNTRFCSISKQSATCSSITGENVVFKGFYTQID